MRRTDAIGGSIQDQMVRAVHDALAMIAAGRELHEILDALIRQIERQSDGMLGSVLLLDEDGVHVRHGAAPTLPARYVEAVDGSAIGPRTGSCGTAMHSKTRVIVTDIAHDPLWTDFRDLAIAADLRACWSAPIFSTAGDVLGSFAMYYRVPREPAPPELHLIDAAAMVAGIAIERHRDTQTLRRVEARNRAILRAIPHWMFLMSRDGVYLDCHVKDTSALYAQPSTFIGKSVHEVLPKWLADRMMATFAKVNDTDESQRIEYSMGFETDERFYAATVVPCDGDKFLSIVEDVTAQKRSEMDASEQRRALAHLSRVAVLGELAGGLAHELSQPLAVILANAQAARRMTRRDPTDDVELRAALDDIVKSTTRATEVIDQVRGLLRKEDGAFDVVNLNDVVREVVDIAHTELAAGRIVARLALTGQPMVAGIRVQLQQVVLNLILNACDAMAQTPVRERELVLATATVASDVQLRVSDRGSGIPQRELQRIFEPFVTSRKHGLGIGLSISRSIVVAHQGRIWAENNADGGATFHCCLPLTDSVKDAPRHRNAPVRVVAE